jgi:hypothetical protein
MLILQYGNKNFTNLTHLAHNSEWFIYNTCALNKTIETSAGLKWWVTRYAIQIKRESVYHFYTLLMPCCVLSLCSLLLFWLPPDSEEKITLGTTILLALFVNSLIVSNYTPEASFELPVIGKYYACNIFFVSLSLAGAVFILRLHFRGYKTNRVPKWIRFLFKIERLNSCESTVSSFDLNNKTSNSFVNFKTLKCVQESESLIKQESNNNNNIRKRSIYKLLELIKYDLRKKKEAEQKRQELDLILVEWKELGRKIEWLFFIINLFAVVTLPTVLFINYLFQDLSADHSLQESCSCDSTYPKIS